MSDLTVYAMFDHDGGLLYVGRTGDFAQRLAHHRSQQPWRRVIASFECRDGLAPVDATLLERRLIWQRKPRHNRQWRRSGAQVADQLPRPIAMRFLGFPADSGWWRQVLGGFGLHPIDPAAYYAAYRYDDVEAVARDLLEASA